MRVLAFDVFGTLLDVGALREVVSRRVSDAERFVSLWRSKQLEYTFLLSLMSRFLTFTEVTRRALMYADRRMGTGLSDREMDEMMRAWETLPPYPDVAEALDALRSSHEMVVLSNGDLRLLEGVLQGSGLRRYFSRLLSAEQAGVYKPSPRVYGLVQEALGLLPEDVGLVSSNPFDIMGSKAAGLRALWVNRGRMPMDPLDLGADLEVESLRELPRRVGELP